jgi:hypothetical protein
MDMRKQGMHANFSVVEVMRRDVHWCPGVGVRIVNPILDRLTVRIRSEM